MPFTAITTAFNSPIGIDFHEHTGTVIITVNYPSGNPLAFERVETDGSHVPFSPVSGLSNEVKITTARTGRLDSQWARCSLATGLMDRSSGSARTEPASRTPGSRLPRRGKWTGPRLPVRGPYRRLGARPDRGDDGGEVWRVDAGTTTPIADVGVHLEGLMTVPDAPIRYGPLAGKIIAGAEGEGLMYTFDTAGNIETYSLGVAIEDIDFIEPYENFFGVNYGTSRLIGVPAEDFLPMAGDILLTQESVTNIGLYHLRFDGTNLVVEELSAAPGGAPLGQWEHVTTAAAGIQEVPE